METKVIHPLKKQADMTWPDWLKSLEIGVPNPIEPKELFSVRPEISKFHYLTDMKFNTEKVSGIPNVIRKA